MLLITKEITPLIKAVFFLIIGSVSSACNILITKGYRAFFQKVNSLTVEKSERFRMVIRSLSKPCVNLTD